MHERIVEAVKETARGALLKEIHERFGSPTNKGTAAWMAVQDEYHRVLREKGLTSDPPTPTSMAPAGATTGGD